MPDVVAEMEKSFNEKILFSVSEFKGRQYADIRVYYEDDEGEWKPTKKGVTVALDGFSEFVEHVQALEAHLKQKKLI